MKCLKYATGWFCFTLFLPFEKKSEQHSWFVLFLQLGIGMGQGIFDFLKLIYQVQKSIIYLVSTGLLDTLKIYRNCCCFPSQVNFRIYATSRIWHVWLFSFSWPILDPSIGIWNFVWFWPDPIKLLFNLRKRKTFQYKICYFPLPFPRNLQSCVHTLEKSSAEYQMIFSSADADRITFISYRSSARVFTNFRIKERNADTCFFFSFKHLWNKYELQITTCNQRVSRPERLSRTCHKVDKVLETVRTTENL